jgi:formylmethanofuran dehydrogenase subunit E
MDCLRQIGIQTIDWHTNGDNVFIFTPDTDNAFDLDFEDVDVFGKKLTEAKERYCSVCGEPIEDEGHNTEKGLVCDGCALHFAIGG